MILFRKLIERDIEISERVLEQRPTQIIGVHVIDLIYRSLKYWYSNYIPLADKVKLSIIRGKTMHRDIARILNEMNRCTDSDESKSIERIDIEKKLMKPYLVNRTVFIVFIVEGRANAIVRYKDYRKESTSSHKHHEDQLNVLKHIWLR